MMGHHLILGDISDFLTGETLVRTLDEELRQDLARLLVVEKGYVRDEIRPRREIVARAGGKAAVVKVDLTVTLGARTAMIVKFGPGSIVTRHRPALAASRLLAPYQIPVVVVTNGLDADVLDGSTGDILGSGLSAIPAREQLSARISQTPFPSISRKRAELESRILYAFEVDGSCPCDESICPLPMESVR